MKIVKEAFITKKNIKNIKIGYKWPNPFNIQEKDLVGDIKDYPMEIITLAMLETRLQRSKFTLEHMTKSDISGAFSWVNSEDGFDFWDGICNCKDFSEFYKKYTPEYLRKRLEENGYSIR